MNRSDLINGITHYLTHLRMQVEHLNNLNLQDDNVHAENFFRDLLMASAWGLNALVAEWLIRRRRPSDPFP